VIASDRIVKTPDVCGGEARVAGTRIPVWGLVEARRLKKSDDALLRDYPQLKPADLTAAWFYAASHADEIERCLWRNEAAMVGQGADVPPELIERGRRLGLDDEQIREAFEPPLDQATLDRLSRRATGA
jgi:uncharacterized protein (DUF433 family)